LRIEKPELARQVQLSRSLIQELGGCVPPDQVDLSQVHTVLDAACGAGGWVLELAQAYPHIQVTGIDICRPRLIYARRLAQERRLSNARFLVQDLYCLHEAKAKLLSESFDLIHMAFIAPSLITMDYTVVLRALLRLCRPGGMLCWTEMEFPLTTSPAFEHLTMLVCRALQAAGQSFIPSSFQQLEGVFDQWQPEAGQTVTFYERRQLGITPMMGGWFRETGYQNVQHCATALEVSAGVGMHPGFVRQVEVFGHQIRPFLLEQEVITQDAYEQLLCQVQEEVQQDTFCGLCFVLTMCAHKPLPANAAPPPR
jgi:ubiquinone/menaquinone biosynthesis C-methylase UbiE